MSYNVTLSHPSDIKQLYLGEQMTFGYDKPKIGGTLDLRPFTQLELLQMKYGTLSNFTFLTKAGGFLPKTLKHIEFWANDFYNLELPAEWVEDNNIHSLKFYSSALKGKVPNLSQFPKLHTFSAGQQYWGQWVQDRLNAGTGAEHVRWRGRLRSIYYNSSISEYNAVHSGFTGLADNWDVPSKLRIVNLLANSLSPADIDTVFIKLDNAGNTNGVLNIVNQYDQTNKTQKVYRTSSSDTAKANLLAKSWTVAVDEES